MPTPTFQPSLADVIRRHVEEAAFDLHVAIPAQVTKVSLAKGMIDAKPLVKEVIEPLPGQRKAVSCPIITNVPVVWPGAGGMRITFPMAVGDLVLLVFADRSLDAWLATSGGEMDPNDPRRHATSDAVAIPGIKPFGKPWAGADTRKITIGSENGASHTAAWADQVTVALNNLKNAIENHTHKYNPGPGAPTPCMSAKLSQSPLIPVSLPDVESKTTLIKG